MTMNETTTESAESAPEEDVSFASLGLGKDVLAAIDDMGWDEPTPVQARCYPLAIEGKDLIVMTRTGTGKTAAFGIPIVDRLVDDSPGVQALVLAPTRELALQSAREIGRLGAHKSIQTAAVYGGAPMERQVRQLKEGAQIVSGTPGRVLDHLRRGTLDPSGLRVFVLDEADEMLSMGFAKELHAIMELLPKEKQTLLFSATVEGAVQRIGERHMTDPEFVTLSGDAVGALGVSHFIYLVSGKGRANDLVKIIETENPESAIIFCNRKAETEQVSAVLQQAGYAADWLNGDLPQGEREKVMARTRKSELRFLVATDVAARGIDISHLTHVVNFGLPEHLEQYIHRTGRTGRAGRTGTAISLVAPPELGILYYLRLQYGIFPVERSLPTRGEERTRREMDRLDLLREAMTAKDPGELDVAIARRLMTHPNAERIVAGLLSVFFGAHADPDEEAAAARRERPPEPAPEPKRETRESKPKREKPTRDRDERRDAKRDEDRERKRDRDDDREPEPTRRARRVEPIAPDDPTRDMAAEDDTDEDGDEQDETKLYVNVGRKDGVRVGDLNRLFHEDGGLDREEVGRIRLRDKHSFVYVPTDKVDDVIERLGGLEFHDRELKVEPARSN